VDVVTSVTVRGLAADSSDSDGEMLARLDEAIATAAQPDIIEIEAAELAPPASSLVT
jgi:hypothetical protein